MREINVESQRENRSRSFDSSPITQEKEKEKSFKRSHHERKRAGSLTSSSSVSSVPSDIRNTDISTSNNIQNNNVLLMSDNPILLKSTSAPSTPKRNTSTSTSTSSSSSTSNFQVNNSDNIKIPHTDVHQIDEKSPNPNSNTNSRPNLNSNTDFYVRTESFTAQQLESQISSPNISSKSVSNDQESGKSMDSITQDNLTGYQSTRITDGVGIRSTLPPSRSPVTRSPSPPAAINRSTKSNSFPSRPGGASTDQLSGFNSNYSHSPFLSPPKQKIPRSPRRYCTFFSAF